MSGIKKLQKAEEFFAKETQDERSFHSHCKSEHLALSYFLRATNGRSDLAKLVQVTAPESFTNSIEKIRTAVYEGNYDLAQSLASALSCSTEIEKAELNVELARIALYTNKTELSLELIKSCLSASELSITTKITLLQMQGHALLSAQRHSEAIESLKSAVTMATVFPNLSSSFSARAFLVRAYAELKQFSNAEFELFCMSQQLSKIEQSEMWLDRTLTFLRAKSIHLKEKNSLLERNAILQEAAEIAKWLGDKGSELKSRGEILGDDIKGIVLRFSGWSYLPQLDLILNYETKKIDFLKDSPIAKKVILVLSGGGISSDKLFERVWGLKYEQDRHAVHLRAMLSKMRKKLPSNTLQVKDGVVFIV